MNNKQEEMEDTNMKMIKAIVRPEKSEDVLDALLAGGFAAATKMSVLGRGKQKGLKVGDTYYFVYSSILMHELCYATSKNPTSVLTY